ncbi:MAG: hypothetical protein Q4F41_11215 [Eubacteriales bacterium]|nr:hypothetical protein [Eubacteriales bacterium]
MEHLDQARNQMTVKMKEYKDVCETEKVIQENIEKIHRDAEIDFEIFSPRAGEKSLRNKANEYYEKLKEVQERKVVLKKEIDQISGELEKFKVMAAELMVLEKRAEGKKKRDVSRET